MSHFSSHTACLESPLSLGSETVVRVTATHGVARVSTTGQELDAQLTALAAAAVGRFLIFVADPRPIRHFCEKSATLD